MDRMKKYDPTAEFIYSSGGIAMACDMSLSTFKRRLKRSGVSLPKWRDGRTCSMYVAVEHVSLLKRTILGS